MISKPAQLLLIALVGMSGIATVSDCLRVRRESMDDYIGWWAPRGEKLKWQSLPVTWSYQCGDAGSDAPEFREAAEWWNKRTGKRVFFEFPCSTGEVWITEAEDIPGDPAIARTMLSVHFSMNINGSTTRFGETFMSMQPGAKATAARHELGHALGYGHVLDPDCLMYCEANPDAGSPKDLCQEELDLFNQVYFPDAGP